MASAFGLCLHLHVLMLHNHTLCMNLFSDSVLEMTANIVRLILCVTGPLVFAPIVGKELRIEGFLFGSYQDEFPSILADLKQWVDEVRIAVFIQTSRLSR